VRVRANARDAALILGVLALTACATPTARTIPVRESTAAEARTLSAALGPLLAELDDPALYRAGCKIGLAIMPSPRINASAGPGRATPCTTFTLIVTEGALTRLPVGMLRAVLAHELGHVALRHSGGNTRAFEAAADAFAVKLLRRIEPRYPDACVQLVYVFSVLADQGGFASAWLAAHPSPDRRAEVAMEGCNR